MTKRRLPTLQPRLANLPTTRLRTLPTGTPRVRGRKGVERRARWLSANPLCEHCKAAGRVTAAEEVDHVIPLSQGGADDESNLASLCVPCHRAKTASDAGYARRPEIGTDGWPV